MTITYHLVGIYYMIVSSKLWGVQVSINEV